MSRLKEEYSDEALLNDGKAKLDDSSAKLIAQQASVSANISKQESAVKSNSERRHYHKRLFSEENDQSTSGQVVIKENYAGAGPSKREQVTSVFSDRVLFYRVGLAIEIAGTVLLSTNLIMDTAYLFKQTFAGHGLYAVYCVLMATRFLIPLMNVIRYCVCRLNDPGVRLVDDDDKSSRK